MDKETAVNKIEYRSWTGMKDRCNSDSPRLVKHYKARGISYCSEWESFENFLRDMGEKPFPKAQLDRIDNDKGYSKDNCRWTSPLLNLKNRRKKDGKFLPVGLTQIRPKVYRACLNSKPIGTYYSIREAYLKYQEAHNNFYGFENEHSVYTESHAAVDNG